MGFDSGSATRSVSLYLILYLWVSLSLLFDESDAGTGIGSGRGLDPVLCCVYASCLRVVRACCVHVVHVAATMTTTTYAMAGAACGCWDNDVDEM